jgi:DnaJ-class molecular chaperone
MAKSDREIVDELDARDRLVARSYERKTCPKCNGFGQFGSIQCWQCEGKGYYWEAPITR